MSQPAAASDPYDFDQLHVSKASRHYGRRRALHRVSLQLAAGELVGLLGPNGAGKSTLLGLLATLIAPSAGVIRYGDRTARDAGAGLRAQVGFLSHDLQLYPELTARENLEFFAHLYGLSDVTARVSAALDRARLADRADDAVIGYSRGMRQRLALERTLLHQPRLVLLDEPFTGLDERSTRVLVERLQELRAARNLVLLATHDLDIVDGLVDRAVMLRRGRVVELPESGGSLRDRYRMAMRGD